ncbi:MAG TPA: 2-C-methyl-D-erythritol 2,4-cyclodiphosphate synthase [Thermodesulfobacteriota bacterium]|nr:2-C-methyl-D-erythritol 2,4-cyclodiphosphate synthase [Thermodesulfobacteriota bacterium]HNU72142.1 2-C-methyl-D-erythritol 2,4-cyclodiphosphate synthase [Thermodesulfobacteriota bacterium]
MIKQGGLTVGCGYDVHAFTEGRPLYLGGVEIPYPRGLRGHSDADVLLHALCDALLGAAGGGDIGIHFPDTDPQYAGIASLILLERTWTIVRSKGFLLGNADVTVVAQKPKLKDYLPAMKQRIAEVLKVDEESINIKATTTEGLGFEGREEGIAVFAVVLLLRSKEKEKGLSLETENEE